MQKSNRATFGHYLPLIAGAGSVFTLAAVLFLFVFNIPEAAPFFIIFGVIECGCMIAYALLPAGGKRVARMLSMILIGGMLFFMAGILGRQNFQVEGLFFLVLGGVFGGAFIHFGMKVLGSLVSGRSWCSWGCWSAALFDFLPYKRDIRWKGGAWRFSRYVHILLSAGITTGLVLGAGYAAVRGAGLAEGTPDVLYWFAGGNVLYYASGIVLAIIMKDNRAFCKYLCPVAILLKAGNIVSLVRVKAMKKDCTGCSACETACPAGIAITAYASNGDG